MTKTIRITIAALILLMPLTACQTTRAPSISGDVTKMSSETLCFRYAGAKKDEAVEAEIAARNLDCTTLLRDDPLLSHQRELDQAHRIGR